MRLEHDESVQRASFAENLEIVELSLEYRHGDGWLRALDRVSFTVAPQEVFGLAGESGCGKSSLAYSCLGYLPANARATSGQVLFRGDDVLRLDRERLRRLRGARISLVPQNPTTALNPGMRAGEQTVESLLYHGAVASRRLARERTKELFDGVGLPEAMMRRYPHELSGGQQQRVCIAIALACDPELVVLDEPTTGLDVTTQAQILMQLNQLRERMAMSMLYVTHDLGVLAQVADRVGVMYAGHMVETAPAAELFGHPRHPYSRGLIATVPRIADAGEAIATRLRGLLRREELPVGCPFSPRCDFVETTCASTPQALEVAAPGHAVACQRWRPIAELVPVPVEPADARARPSSRAGAPMLEVVEVTARYGPRIGWLSRFRPEPAPAVDRVSFDIHPGETFALVGESGSGKSTIARAISGLLAPSEGEIRFNGRPLPASFKSRTPELKRHIQYIFQNPDASLNPRVRVHEALSRPLDLFFGSSRREASQRVARALDEVRLEPGYARRFPDELSGGERQRIAIARALVADPMLLLCDEILSALDVSVQANIVDLLTVLKRETEVSMLFISHDLAVVRSIADRVGVLFRGTLVETGDALTVFTPPFHPYTHELLLAVPGEGTGPPMRAHRAPLGISTDAPRGCPFVARCPWQMGTICLNEPPPWRETGTLRIRCHIGLEELSERTELG